MLFLVRCPLCRSFTTVLANFYLQHHQEKYFEIIFISSDQDEASFHQYYSEMPWLALDFYDQLKKQELSNRFNVSGIPKLVLLDANSAKVICEDAIIQIQHYDQRGDYFPWKSRGSGSSRNRSCSIL